MANVWGTKKYNDIVALRAAETAGYLTVGSKSYFSDQLVGKRNGEEYEFVIRDAGKYVKGKNITGQSSEMKERKVTKKIEIGNVMIDTDFVEAVTDVNWDKEIAQPNGKALIEGLVSDVIKADIGLQNVCFVGRGWLPLSKAAGYLRSVSSEQVYGFIDPQIDSIVAAGGKSFTPVDAEPLYKTGMIGKFAGVEYREQNFLPQLEISEDLANELSSATVSSYVQAEGASAGTLTLSGVTEVIPAGTPIFLEGVYATNLIGNKTSSLKAFIAIEDATSGAVKVRPVDFAGQGTKTLCNKNGEALTAAGLAGKKVVNAIKAGSYFTGILRSNGTMEFDTLKKQDWSNADLTSESIEGVTVHTARAVNVEAGTNKTRWAVAAIAGIVEPRAVAYVCIQDCLPNEVQMVTA